MQAHTHVAVNTASLILFNTIFSSPEITTLSIFISSCAAVAPDIDNNKSLIGRATNIIGKVFTLNYLELSQHCEHRKTLHNPFVVFGIIGVFYYFLPEWAGIITLSLLNHLFCDLFQERGIHVYGTHWLVFSDNVIPNRSNKEICIFITALFPTAIFTIFIVPIGGADSFIRLCIIRTPEAIIEEYRVKYPDWLCDFYVSNAIMTISGTGLCFSKESKEPQIASGSYKIVGIEDDRIILKDKSNGLLHSLGNKYSKNTLIAFGSCKLFPLTQVNIVEYDFSLEHMLLSELANMIDNSHFYYFVGSAQPGEHIEVIKKQTEYNPIFYTNGQLQFRWCTLDDIRDYGLENAYIEKSNFHVVYKVPQGQAISIKHPAEMYKSKRRQFKIPFCFYIENISNLVISEKDFVKEGQVIARINSCKEEVKLLKQKLKATHNKIAAAKAANKYALHEIRVRKYAFAAKKRMVKKRLNNASNLAKGDCGYFQKYVEDKLSWRDISEPFVSSRKDPSSHFVEANDSTTGQYNSSSVKAKVEAAAAAGVAPGNGLSSAQECHRGHLDHGNEVRVLLQDRIAHKASELVEDYKRSLNNITAELASLNTSKQTLQRAFVYQTAALEEEKLEISGQLKRLEELSVVKTPATGMVSVIRFFPVDPPKPGPGDKSDFIEMQSKWNLKVKIIILTQLD